MGVLAAALGGALYADEVDREFEFAGGLIEIGFPDFAEKVVEQVLMKYPDQKDRAKLVRAQILISNRKFDEAQAIVAEMPEDNPKAQAITLALAGKYYQINELDKARELYENFFRQFKGKTPTDPDLKRFYMDASYQFGQMLEKAEDYEGAVKAYNRVLATNPDKAIKRNLQSDQAYLYLKVAEKDPDNSEKHIGKALELCNDLQWGGMDIWFGHSVIVMARAELLRGDKAKAQQVLKEQMDILKEVDRFIKEQDMPMKVSPMAGARFMLGELYDEQGQSFARKKDAANAIKYLGQALGEYYNVFAKYGGSDWGPEAGVRAKALKDQLESQYGKIINIDMGEYASEAAATQMRLADTLFFENKYPEAREQYIKVLNDYPETAAAPTALGNLAECYRQADDTLYTKMVIEYLGERFPKNDNAAVALLQLGKKYFDAGNEDMFTYTYEVYLDGFPEHQKAPGVLYTLAGMRKNAGDTEKSSVYFQRLVDNYPNDKYYIKALSSIAWDYYLGKNYTMAIPALTKYIEATQPGFDRAQAQFCLADAYRQTGDIRNALVAFVELLKWLKPENSEYDVSADDVKKNDDLEEKATFYVGYCYSLMTEPAESVPAFKKKAVQFYSLYLSQYPDGELASKAMNGMGTIQLSQDDFDGAVATFNDLAVKYPDSNEGKNALYSLIRSAMEVKKFDVARDALRKMLNDSQAYSPDEFLRVGQLMLNAGLYPETLEAMSIVLEKSQDREHQERALYSRGEAYYAMKDYANAAATMDELMTKYPKSGLFYDAKFIMGEAYRETGELDKATDAMSDVMKFASDALRINQASMILGQIQRAQDDKVGALASFQRVCLLAPNTPELRPVIRQCLMDSIALSQELGRYQDAQEICEQFLEQFPDDPEVPNIRKLWGEVKLKASVAAAAPPPQTGSDEQ